MCIVHHIVMVRPMQMCKGSIVPAIKECGLQFHYFCLDFFFNGNWAQVIMYDVQVRQRNYKKYAIISGCLMVFGLFFSLFLFPTTVVTVLKHQLRLKPGYVVRKMYETIPFPLIFKIYIFDVLNKEEILHGEKPHLKQIGPYVFHEYITKYDTTDDKDEDTLEYSLRKVFQFQPQLSNGLTGDEIVTTLHPVLVSMGLAVNVDRKGMIPLVAAAINEIFHHPKDAFWTGRAMDIMFDGLPMDCSSEDFNSKAVCSLFEAGESQQVEPMGDDQYKFSIMGGYNYTNSGVFKVLRGVKHSQDLGRILRINGEEEEEAWDGDECNAFRGTDGLIFPPFGKKEDLIWVHEKLVCRAFGVPFEKKSKYRGIPVHVFTYDLGDIANTESDICFCRSEDECPLKGTIDLFPCLNVPITLSMPHFYNADPSLLAAVDGLSPIKKEHEIFVKMELFTGAPLSAAKRVQFNFELEPIEGIEQMKNLPKVTFPWIWIEEGANLPSWMIYLIKFGLIMMQRLTRIIKYLSMSIAPLATIAFLTVHVLIQTGHISVVNDVRAIKQFVPSEIMSPRKDDIISTRDAKSTDLA